MKKWFFSYRNNDISYTHDRGHATLRGIFEKMCNLMRLGEYFDQILYIFFFKSSFCIEQCYLRELTDATTQYDIC